MYAKRAAEERIDRYAGPYERWVFSNELGRPFSFPLIAGAQSGFYTALMEGGAEPKSTSDMAVRIPPLWNPDGGRLEVTPFVFQNLGPPFQRANDPEDTKIATGLDSLRKGSSLPGEMAPRFRVNFPVIPDTWVPVYQQNSAPADWTAPATPPKAIVAVIDDGLPFAHRAFLGSDGRTRVSHCWLQSGLAEAQASVPFGREYVNAQIDALRAAHGADESALYRAAGAMQTGVSELGTHLRRAATHGSHVMGLAAGNHALFRDHPMGDDVQVIAVQLPNTIAWDTSGFGKEMYMLSAIHYVFERASRIAQHCGVPELPLIVNFSYGWSAGRHDGQSEMEIAIEALVQKRRAAGAVTEFVMPTGNNFASEMHARFEDARFSGHELRVGWQVQPDDRTSSYMELWFPEGFDPSDYTVTVDPPRGTTLDRPAVLPVTADMTMDGGDEGDPRRFVEIEKNGDNIGQLSADRHRGNRWRVMVALIPTAYTRHQSRRAPSGLWTVTVSRKANAARINPKEALLIWLQRDDDPSNLRSHGRQSRLVDLGAPETPRPGRAPQRVPEDVPALCGYGSLNGVASSPSTTRVGGYEEHSGRPTLYSGAGGLRQVAPGKVKSWGQQTDVSAVADQSLHRPGIPSIGVLSGARARLVGTSGAAPSVARLMALNAAAGRPVLDGCLPPLPPHPVEASVPAIARQNSARVGTHTAPPVIRGGTRALHR